MKVVREAPTGRSRRLIVTEHGIPYQARASRERSAHSSRRSHDLPGRTRRSSTGRRGTGGRYAVAMRYARCGEPQWHCISLVAQRRQDRLLESEVIRKRSCLVRRGATGKGPLQDGTSPVAYSTWVICSQNRHLQHDLTSPFLQRNV